MKIAIPKETVAGERRVALIPESVKKLTTAGYTVGVESGAGAEAHISDEQFVEAGATIAPDAATLLADADLVLKVQPPVHRADIQKHEAQLLKDGAVLLTTLAPLANLDAVEKLAANRVSAFSTDCIPRITRAQSMDTLSSMSSIAGYKAVLLAANALGQFFPMMMTAAGTIRPAKVFIIGAGVAGLQAIATARRMGAVVEASDVRPAVKEQVESLGAKFVAVEMPTTDAETKGGYAKEMTAEFLDKQRQFYAERCAANNVVITTALVFGKKAPMLLSDEMVKGMKPGSVVVDLATEQGGNCASSEPGTTCVKHGVTIIGEQNLPSTMPVHASQMYSRNLTTFVMEFTKEGNFMLDLEDEIIKGALVTHNGEVVHELTRKALAES